MCDGCTVENNIAVYHGGGIFVDNSDVRLYRTVVRNNVAYGRGWTKTDPAAGGQNIMVFSGLMMCACLPPCCLSMHAACASLTGSRFLFNLQVHSARAAGLLGPERRLPRRTKAVWCLRE